MCEWFQSILKSENRFISAFESICMFFYWSVISSQSVWYNYIRKFTKSHRIFYTAEKWRSKKIHSTHPMIWTYWILSKTVVFSIFCTYIWHTKHANRTRWAIIWLKYGLLSPSIPNLWQLILYSNWYFCAMTHEICYEELLFFFFFLNEKEERNELWLFIIICEPWYDFWGGC